MTSRDHTCCWLNRSASSAEYPGFSRAPRRLLFLDGPPRLFCTACSQIQKFPSVLLKKLVHSKHAASPSEPRIGFPADVRHLDPLLQPRQLSLHHRFLIRPRLEPPVSEQP